jgi:hypothetical protein
MRPVAACCDNVTAASNLHTAECTLGAIYACSPGALLSALRHGRMLRLQNAAPTYKENARSLARCTLNLLNKCVFSAPCRMVCARFSAKSTCIVANEREATGALALVHACALECAFILTKYVAVGRFIFQQQRSVIVCRLCICECFNIANYLILYSASTQEG